jgi:hypothetical protein
VKNISKLLLMICLVMGLGAAIANAQMPSDITLEANIPHTFVVKDTTLPAGTYFIRMPDETEPNVLEIRSTDDRKAIFFETDSTLANRTPGKNELVFDNIADQYFLSQIIVDGDNSGSQLPKSKMQRRLEREGLKSEKQSVALNRTQSGSKQSAKKGSQ